jgi:hypothetical protein
MYIISLLFALAGLTCIVRYKSFSEHLVQFYARRSKRELGIHFEWEKPRYRIVFKAVVIGFGVFLLIMALHFAFGTIYTGSAQP